MLIDHAWADIKVSSELPGNHTGDYLSISLTKTLWLATIKSYIIMFSQKLSNLFFWRSCYQYPQLKHRVRLPFAESTAQYDHNLFYYYALLFSAISQ